MPLSKVERQVLTLVCDEHRQTRRGAKALIVHVGMNAKTGQQKARIVDVLHALKKCGLLVASADSWVPTSEGEAALCDEAPVMPPVCDECKAVLTPDELEFLESSCSACETKAFHVAEFQEFSGTVERIGAPLPDDLLNRCAAMNAALLAQAKQAHEQGEPEAWRAMAWLIETGKQLIAAGGEA